MLCVQAPGPLLVININFPLVTYSCSNILTLCIYVIGEAKNHEYSYIYIQNEHCHSNIDMWRMFSSLQ